MGQAKFMYTPLSKFWEKQKKRKTIGDQRKKEIKATKDHKKQLIESNAPVKKWIWCWK